MSRLLQRWDNLSPVPAASGGAKRQKGNNNLSARALFGSDEDEPFFMTRLNNEGKREVIPSGITREAKREIVKALCDPKSKVYVSETTH